MKDYADQLARPEFWVVLTDEGEHRIPNNYKIQSVPKIRAK